MGMGNTRESEVDPKRKLILVGQFGACASEGWEGKQDRHVKISDDLRRWSTNHPNATVRQSLRSLLAVIALDWVKAGNDMQHLPSRHPLGSQMTGLYCVDVSEGEPHLFVGITKVALDGTAQIEPITETKEPLTIAGIFDTRTFIRLITDPNFRYAAPESEKAMDRKFISVFESDFTGMTAFNEWRNSPYSATQSIVKSLTMALFRASEIAYTGEIAPPNMLVLSSTRGRVLSRVEGNWPSN